MEIHKPFKNQRWRKTTLSLTALNNSIIYATLYSSSFLVVYDVHITPLPWFFLFLPTSTFLVGLSSRDDLFPPLLDLPLLPFFNIASCFSCASTTSWWTSSFVCQRGFEFVFLVYVTLIKCLERSGVEVSKLACRLSWQWCNSARRAMDGV